MATQLIWPQDTEALAVNAFKDEGAFLFKAQQMADAMGQRILNSHAYVRYFHLTREEFTEYAYLLSRAVTVAAEYHCGCQPPE